MKIELKTDDTTAAVIIVLAMLGTFIVFLVKDF